MATTIHIEAEINAELSKVWNYYTAPEHIVNWNFAHESWCCPSASNDLRVGGTYSARMEARDGSFGFDFGATYNEVAINEKLVYTIGDGRRVEINFTNSDNGTQLSIDFEAESVNPVEMQQQGWQAILNNFKNYTENN